MTQRVAHAQGEAQKVQADAQTGDGLRNFEAENNSTIKQRTEATLGVDATEKFDTKISDADILESLLQESKDVALLVSAESSAAEKYVTTSASKTSLFPSNNAPLSAVECLSESNVFLEPAQEITSDDNERLRLHSDKTQTQNQAQNQAESKESVLPAGLDAFFKAESLKLSPGISNSVTAQKDYVTDELLIPTVNHEPDRFDCHSPDQRDYLRKMTPNQPPPMSAGSASSDLLVLDDEPHVAASSTSRPVSSLTLADFEAINYNSNPFESLALDSINDKEALALLLDGPPLNKFDSSSTALVSGAETPESSSDAMDIPLLSSVVESSQTIYPANKPVQVASSLVDLENNLMEGPRKDPISTLPSISPASLRRPMPDIETDPADIDLPNANFPTTTQAIVVPDTIDKVELTASNISTAVESAAANPDNDAQLDSKFSTPPDFVADSIASQATTPQLVQPLTSSSTNISVYGGLKSDDLSIDEIGHRPSRDHTSSMTENDNRAETDVELLPTETSDSLNTSPTPFYEFMRGRKGPTKADFVPQSAHEVLLNKYQSTSASTGADEANANSELSRFCNICCGTLLPGDVFCGHCGTPWESDSINTATPLDGLHSLSTAKVHNNPAGECFQDNNVGHTRRQKMPSSAVIHHDKNDIDEPATREATSSQVLPESTRIGMGCSGGDELSTSSSFDPAIKMYVQMGFVADAVPLALSKFDAQDEVINRLLQIKELCDDRDSWIGAPSAKIADAVLDECEGVAAAIQYLRKSTTLEQMGFTKEAIKAALARTNGDLRQAIDVLSSETAF